MIALWLVLGIVGAVLLLHMMLGFRSSQQTRAVQAYMLQEGRRRTRQSFTVMLTLDRRADTILPLLDHLRSNGYPKLQVVIMIKQTAGSKAQATLASYKRKHQLKDWRIVSHRRGMTLDSAAQRYATGKYVMTLQANSRVDEHFFDRLSRALVATKAPVMMIRSLVRPVGTFAMAILSIGTVIRATTRQLLGRPYMVDSLTEGVVIDRQSLRDDTVLTTRPFLTDQLYIDSTATVAAKPYVGARGLAGLSITAVIVGAFLTWLWLTVTSSEAWLWTGLLTAVAITVVISLQLSNKGYRAIDILNTALFIPIAPVYGLLRFIAYLIGQAIAARRQRQASRP
jgi:hypothetical protein